MTEASAAPALELVLPRLIQQCVEILEIDGLEADANFFDFGGDSLAVVELLGAIHDEWGVELAVDQLLSASDLTAVAIIVTNALAHARPA
ncbi:acyl carrier protein [Glycomyces tritici]|uniref:Acyl carrier protein n=1 Tax=Glycomyces tritici TaxID=2665176 RepID=A0ABT7YX26_9ACTN|nr:acyl carrier protein [Glycomyces tritici]MDN3243180.1 acyl carrier protein [Glycomyces tritici]